MDLTNFFTVGFYTLLMGLGMTCMGKGISIYTLERYKFPQWFIWFTFGMVVCFVGLFSTIEWVMVRPR